MPDWAIQRDFNGDLSLFQVYSQGQYKLNKKWTLNAGLHAQYLEFNDDYAVEPRLAINYSFRPNQRLSLAYGLHHQTQPMPILFYQEEVSEGVFEPTNEDLTFTRAHHYVLAYDLKLGTNWRVKVETYYQQMDRVPVEQDASSFSMLNAGADFEFPERGSLVNEGTGRNYGLELTVEKFFSDGYYGLFSGSLYESKYEGSDGVERNTAFNNQYVANLLAGKEIKIGKEKRNALSFDLKVTTAGGRYFTPVDLEASRAEGEEVLREDMAFSEQFDPYFRLDFKIGLQLNSKERKFSQQFYLDFRNLTDYDNVFDRRFNELTNEVNTVYQAGFFPDILYRIQF